MRAEIRNREAIKLAWGLGATVSSLEIRTDFRKVDGAAWLPMRDETLAAGRLLLLKRFRTAHHAVVRELPQVRSGRAGNDTAVLKI